jgi:uncharacterized protein YjiS (DUF1127 family)
MTMISSAASQAPIAGTSGGLLRWIGVLAQALVDHLARRAAIKVLSQRDDRELRDIGLLRSQIEDAVSGAFHPRGGGMT